MQVYFHGSELLQFKASIRYYQLSVFSMYDALSFDIKFDLSYLYLTKIRFLTDPREINANL